MLISLKVFYVGAGCARPPVAGNAQSHFARKSPMKILARATVLVLAIPPKAPCGIASGEALQLVTMQ